MGTNTELVLQVDTAVANLVNDETGLDQVVGLKPTNMILVQNTTRDTKGARPGQLLDVLTEQAYDSVVGVPMRVTPRRVMFAPGADLDTEPICRSDNGIVPARQAKAPQATRCVSCPHSQWRNGKKPPCAEKLHLLFILKELGLPRFLTVGGVGIKAMKFVLERIRQDIHINKLNNIHLALYDYYFRISGERVVSKQGSYYIPRFDNLLKVAAVREVRTLVRAVCASSQRA